MSEKDVFDFSDIENKDKKNKQSNNAFYGYDTKEHVVYDELESVVPPSKKVEGMYDYSEAPRVRRRKVHSDNDPYTRNRRLDHLTGKQQIFSILFGAIIGVVGMMISLFLTYSFGIELIFPLLAVPAGFFTHLTLKNRAITIFVVIGYFAGGYLAMVLGVTAVIGFGLLF